MNGGKSTAFLLISVLYVVNGGLFGGWNEAAKEHQADFNWSVYHDQMAFENILENIHKKCPKNTQIYSIGKSVESRELFVIKFSTEPEYHKACKKNDC